MHKGLFFFITLSLFLTTSAADCFAETALSQQNVRDFINKTTDILSGKAGMSTEDMQAYLDKHLDDSAWFKSSMKYNIPGFPAQQNAMKLNKTDFITHAKEGKNALSDYETRVKIGNIKISKDKTMAIVQTTSVESGIMKVPDGGDIEDIPVEGSSECNQIIMLSKAGIIQMYNATCITDIKFSGL